MRTWGVVALLTGIATGALVVARRTLLVVRVDGESMAPAYQSGDRVLAVRRSPGRLIRCGEVVVLRPPGGAPKAAALFIKRVVAVAGDPMPPVNEPITASTVPPGHVFVRGDDPRSYDSRQFGPLPLDHVVGHVVAALSR